MVRKKLLTDAIESLEKAICDFWACPGPDAPFENRRTCHTCHALQCLRELDKPKYWRFRRRRKM